MSTDLRPLTPDAIGASVPRRGHWLVAALGRAVLRLIGWQVVGELPNVPRAVMIAAPHTSNYDGLVGVSAIQGLRLDIRFMAKHTLFRGPAGWLLRALGGMRESLERLVFTWGSGPRALATKLLPHAVGG